MNDIDARTHLKSVVLRWAAELDVQVQSLSIRPMKRKWASCSSAGNLSFSSELLELEDDLKEYVVVHELLHFSVPNHGKLWKSLMRVHLGDFEELDSRLRQYAASSQNARASTG